MTYHNIGIIYRKTFSCTIIMKKIARSRLPQQISRAGASVLAVRAHVYVNQWHRYSGSSSESIILYYIIFKCIISIISYHSIVSYII